MNFHVCMYHNAQSSPLCPGKKPNNWAWEKAAGYTMSLSHPLVGSFTLMGNWIGFQGHEVGKSHWGYTFEYVLSSFICSVVQNFKKCLKRSNYEIQDRRIMLKDYSNIAVKLLIKYCGRSVNDTVAASFTPWRWGTLVFWSIVTRLLVYTVL
jgi:hypothetical protein